MKIIGCDFHPGYQQIAMLDLVTGEMVENGWASCLPKALGSLNR